MQGINNGHGVITRIQQSRLQVTVPYSQEFVVFAHNLDARWRKRSGCWSFHRHQFVLVAKKLNELFGTSIKYHAEDTDV